MTRNHIACLVLTAGVIAFSTSSRAAAPTRAEGASGTANGFLPTSTDPAADPNNPALDQSSNANPVPDQPRSVTSHMNYQGYVTVAGAPLEGSHAMEFRIYDSPSGGTQLWREGQNVSVSGGIFTVILGTVTPLHPTDFAAGTPVYLELVVDGTTLAPRTELAAVAYAFTAGLAHDANAVQGQNLGALDSRFVNTGEASSVTSGMIVNSAVTMDKINQSGATAGQVIKWTGSAWAPGTDEVGAGDNDWIINGNDMYSGVSGSVGIGTSVPDANYRLDVNGWILSHGRVRVLPGTGSGASEVHILSNGAGGCRTWGPNGTTNIALTTLTDNPNNGYVAVADASGAMQAGIYVNANGSGVVWGDTKSFRVPNPNQPGTEIWYACPEGPEAAAYVRGTAHLVGGVATVGFPDHFRAVATSEGMTVTLTPLSEESRGLAVIDKGDERFRVRELGGGTGTYDFDYLVIAVRKGHEDYRVIRPESDGMPETGVTPPPGH